MPPSEIDDIFAAKGTISASSIPSSSSSLPAEKKKKKKKKKDKGKDKSAKRKREDEDAASTKPPKRPVPETVLDPSVPLSSARKTMSAKVVKPAVSATKLKKPKKDREDEDRFKDSRGTGPRRTTEEGFMIYKEDELRITDQGGDTPLCPFDCQCCF